MDRITWEGDQTRMDGYIYGEAEKYKAKILIFSISFRPKPSDEIDRTPYRLAHRLPFRGIERRFGSIKLAQQHAERYLVWAMRLMGFQPIEEES